MKLFAHVVPYLMLVTFASGSMSSFDIDKISAVNVSPYHGVAVPLIEAYDSDTHRINEFEAEMHLIRKKSKKHVWPWIFFNRFAGFNERGRSHSRLADKPYFKKIRALDIYDESGALGDFKDLLRMSLSIARKLNSPGVIIDPEIYNNRNNYSLSYVAKELNRSESAVKERLKHIGKEFVDIADQEYPGATIWFFFSGLTKPSKNEIFFYPTQYRTVTYIIQGMLERCNENNSDIRIVSGGETSLGYCYESVDDMSERILLREKKFEGVLNKYPNLQLGGTIAPWNDRSERKLWMLRERCGSARQKTMSDFEPYIAKLLETYNYVWIYAADAAGYNPYKSDPHAFNDALSNSLSLSR